MHDVNDPNHYRLMEAGTEYADSPRPTDPSAIHERKTAIRAGRLVVRDDKAPEPSKDEPTL